MPWYIFALISAVLVSLSSILEKRALRTANPLQFSAVHSALAAIITLPFLFWSDLSSLNERSLIALYFVSILGCLAYLLVAKAVKHMEVSVVSPLMVLSPAGTALIAFLTLGESLSARQIIAIVLLLLGSYVLQLEAGLHLLHPFKKLSKAKYVFYLFGAVVLYSISATGDRLILSNLGVPPLTYLAVIQIFVALNFLILMIVFADGLEGEYKGLKHFGGAAFLLALVVVLQRWTAAEAISAAAVALAIAVKRSSSLFTVIVGGELFHEKNLFRKTIATSIMIAGLVLLAI